MANAHSKDRKPVTTRHDIDLVERLQARAKAEGRSVNDITEELYTAYLDSDVSAPAAPATAMQLDEVKLGMGQMMQAMQALVQRVEAVQQAQQASLDAMQAHLLEAPAPALPPVDLSGVEAGVAELARRVETLAEAQAEPVAVEQVLAATPSEHVHPVEVDRDDLDAMLDHIVHAAMAENTLEGDADAVTALFARYRMRERA